MTVCSRCLWRLCDLLPFWADAQSNARSASRRKSSRVCDQFLRSLFACQSKVDDNLCAIHRTAKKNATVWKKNGVLPHGRGVDQLASCTLVQSLNFTNWSTASNKSTCCMATWVANRSVKRRPASVARSSTPVASHPGKRGANSTRFRETTLNGKYEKPRAIVSIVGPVAVNRPLSGETIPHPN